MDLEAQQQYNQTCAVDYNARTGMEKRLIIGGYSSMGKPENCTLQYYGNNASAFISGTIAADMGEARSRFMNQILPCSRILDLACGSGRDTKALLDAGFKVDAVDGSAEMCRLASEYNGISVKQMLFQELDAVDTYDGIWACASLLHLSKEELENVLHRISCALKMNGILYTSFKHGTFEGMRSGRYFTDFTEETLWRFWKHVPFLLIIDFWITHDVRPERRDERWINLLCMRT